MLSAFCCHKLNANDWSKLKMTLLNRTEKTEERNLSFEQVRTRKSSVIRFMWMVGRDFLKLAHIFPGMCHGSVVALLRSLHPPKLTF